MKTSRIKISIIAALCVTTTFAEVINLEPVSVTGTKSEEKTIDQALSISVKGEKEVELDQVIVQKDLLNSIAGVQIEQTSSVIGHTTAIRMPENKSSYYLFMQDGIPVQSSGFFNHNGLAYTTFQSATSVEVLKGAGTALYGSDAVAAVINIQSLKKPSKEQEITLKGMGGSYGYGSGSVEMSDTINEDSSYRASVGYMHSDGWRNHTTTDRVEANFRYDHAINDENELKVIFNTSKTEAEQADSFSDYANIENGSKEASDDADYYSALDATDIKRKFDYARLSAEWTNYSFDNLEISLTPYVRYNRNRYVATWQPNYPSSDNEIMTAGLMEKNTYDSSWGRLITGFDTEYTQSSLSYNQDYDTSARGKNYTTGPLFDYDVDYLAVAPYIHGEYDISETLMLTAGLRYDYNHYDYTNNIAANSTDASGVYFRPEDRTDSFSHLSPKLSLQYQASEDINIYARYANGFRIPQASTLYSMKADATQINLDPEISDTFEIGVKKLFAEKSFIELAIYYMTIDDTISSYETSPSSGIYYYENGGKTTHQGIEVTADTQITNEWATHVAYSFSKHNYVNDPSYDDNEIAQAPNHLANARLIYTPSTVKGLRIMAEWQYVGSYWMNDNHTTISLYGPKTAKYSGYSIGNLKVDYRYNKNISIFGKVNNISDEEYATSASSKYSDAFSPGDPRQFFAGLEYRW